MTSDVTNDGARSIDTVIRGFTDAELALREVAGAVDRIRSASEQLDASRADQAAARDAMGESASAIQSLADKLEAVAGELMSSTAALASLDPERLWQQLDSHSATLISASDRASESTERITAQLDQQTRSGRRLMFLVSAALAVGVASLALGAALSIGVLPLR